MKHALLACMPTQAALQVHEVLANASAGVLGGQSVIPSGVGDVSQAGAARRKR